MTAPIRDMAGLIGAMRNRAVALNLSHETIDSIAGVPSGYTSKLFAERPMKNLGYTSMGLLLGALGLALDAKDDPEQIERVRGRWKPRNIVGGSAIQMREIQALASSLALVAGMAENERKLELSNRMKELRGKVRLESLKNSGKRRMAIMSKRARQRQASHAARKRWAKRAEAGQ